MNRSLAFFALYSMLHSVHGQEASSLRGRVLQMAQSPVAADGVNAKEVKSRLQGQNQASWRIIDGSEAIEDRFSYAVSLQYDGYHTCGGSLIAKDVVLTAAHCVYQTTAVLGKHDLNDIDGEEIRVRGELTHPEYNTTTSLENDFKLIFLEGTPTADNVILVKLNSDPSMPRLGQDMTVMGWGDTDPIHDIPETEDVIEFSTPSEVLLSIDVGYLSDEECGTMWGDEAPAPDSMLCAKRSNGQGVCHGDSGGPLVIKGADSASDLQVGIASFVSPRGCADTDIPDVFARVSHVYEWIQSEVCNGSTYASEAGFDCSGSTSTLFDDSIDTFFDVFDGN